MSAVFLYVPVVEVVYAHHDSILLSFTYIKTISAVAIHFLISVKSMKHMYAYHFVKRSPDNRAWRESKAGLLSILTFSWLNELIQLSEKRTLTKDDLWDIEFKYKGMNSYQQYSNIM